jgi:hypothetical protein
MSAEETTGEVEWGRPPADGEPAYAAVGRHKVQARLWLEEVVNADGAEEISQVGTATHADVLAGINELAGGGIGKGTGTTAQSIAGFQDGNAKTAGGQSGGCRQSRQSATDYGYRGVPRRVQAHPQRTGIA